MFRSKVFSVLRSINRSSYDIGHTKLLRNTLFSTNVLRGDSGDTSNVTLNENLSITSQQPQTLDETIQKSKTSTENAEVFLEASVGSNTSSFPTESEPDKLYKKLEIEVRGNNPAVLRSYGEFAVVVAGHLDITVGRHVAIRKPIFERLTLLKSIHVHKKHRVQYERRTYYRYVDLFNLTGSTADTYLEYIERNLPEGVAMKITKVELQTLPKTVKQAMPSQQ
ncbi:mitochondrial ribosomal protein S10 [Bombus vancouverensis nearcticus]|uniref:mitochondrial ribosomal protein S10 n=1 Tax=Bombus vancouverensis nearcticus TaxID=2705178 RepID=UPI00143BB107|nr:28S ribosomal protein S10, mitochondrial [Bombus vancouverensis nearcticus]